MLKTPTVAKTPTFAILVYLCIMADASVVVNELLCFIKSYFGKVPKIQLTTVIAGFYEQEEIVNAKTLLFNFAESKNDNVLRLRPRKAGNNKRRLDVEDIYGLCEFMDIEKNKVPGYVARNLQRIPAIHPSDTDVVRPATKANEGNKAQWIIKPTT